MPSAPALPSIEDFSREKGRSLPRFAFFRRRIRLKGNSSISIPLGFVLLFPCLVIVLILLLFVRHPSSSGRILIPAGAPPSIRFVFDLNFFLTAGREHRKLTNICLSTGKSVRNMTRSSLLDVNRLTQVAQERMLPSSSWPGIRSWRVLSSPSNPSNDTSTDGGTIHMCS